MPLLKIKNLELRIKNLPSAKKLKIEARRQGDESLLSITNEAQSLTDASLLDFGSLSFGKVSKELV